MNQQGNKSLSVAIIEALRDIEQQCKQNDCRNTFAWWAFATRLKAYIGPNYNPSDEMIKRRMRKIRQYGFLDRSKKLDDMVLKYRIGFDRQRNGIYNFNVE